jgi:integrase
MKWDHIRGAWWEIPAEARKNNEENRVPICSMMEAVLEQAKIYSSDSEYVFRSTHTEGRPITVRALTRAIARHSKEIGIEEAFTSHDLRRTVRTGLAKVEVSDIVAEKVLGHKLQGLLAVYNQYPYDKEKRQALMAWERWLQSILGLTSTAGKVISMGDYKHE